MKTSNPVTDELIRKQAQRFLSALANPPEDAKEISIALKRWARSDYHVKSIVQYMIDNSTFFPTPAAIRDCAEMLPAEPPPVYRDPNPDCSVCGGSGFRVIEVNGYASAGNCDCRVPGKPMPPSLERTTEPLPEIVGIGRKL